MSLSRRFVALSLVLFAALAANAPLAHAFGTPKDKDLEKRYLGKTIHPRVNIHVESKKGVYHFYSTNHIGLPIVIPVGADMVVVEVNGADMKFRYGKDNVSVEMDYVEKHNKMSMREWLEKNFSFDPVALPANLTDKEKSAVKAGEAVVGMSREAFFLAVGYPPASLTPSEKENHLVYEKKRFNKVQFDFDDKNKLLNIKD